MAARTTHFDAGSATDPEIWPALYWIRFEPERSINDDSLAIRQCRSDGQWYITHKYAPEVEVLHGPFGSVEAIAVLIHTGLIII